MSSVGEAALEGSFGRHGSRWTNGIVLALSGLAAVVGFFALLFMVQELASMREQQTAFMKQQTDLFDEIQGLKDQVLQMQLRQENEAKDKTDELLSPQGPPGDMRSTEDWRRDHSATFWKRAEVHRRFKRGAMDSPSHNKFEEFLRGYECTCPAGPPGKDGLRGPVGPPGPPGQCGCPAPPPVKPVPTARLVDCAALKAAGHTTSGVYTLGSPLSGVSVYCDMDTAGGGWTLIQRRMDGSVPFNKNWNDYKHGFGNKNGEYWLGNDNIHRLTSYKNYRLRVDMMGWDSETSYAEYNTFRVAGESDQYRLTISGYSGTAGDSMTSSYSNNGQMFSTIDRENDVCPGNCRCSLSWGHAGWWFGDCSYSNPNGRYLRNCGYSCSAVEGVVWVSWRGGRYSLKSVSMKIRPR